MKFVSLTIAFVLTGSSLTGVAKPNIVILLADDLGYRDVSYRRGEIRTPNVDRLAAEGVKLERFYTAPICSPTRAGLLTGRWPIRYGMMDAVIPPWCDYGLPTDERTIADLAAVAGYTQRACIGKWHLGHLRVKWHPLSRGFTYFYGHYNGALDYFTHQREGEVDWHRNHETVREPGYATDLIGAEAVRFIERAPKNEPYLLYVPFNAPHAPFQAKPEDEARYPQLEGERRTYAAMVDCLDQAVGRILEAIEQRGDSDNTLVLFMSDNGGVVQIGDNRPLRGAKLTPYEGGVRSVACLRWANGGLVGGKSIDARLGYIDVYPTLKRVMGMAGAKDANPLDGIDMLDVLLGKAAMPSRDWYTFQSSMVGSGEDFAVHSGPWKLVVAGPSVLEETARMQAKLYRLEGDPGEEHNVAADNPQVVGELLDKARAFRRLNPASGVPRYGEGRKGFKAPRDWLITQ